MNREQILYGRSPIRKPLNEYQSMPYAYDTAEEPEISDNTVKLRYALAAVLMLLIILFDKSGTSIAGVSMEQVFAVIEADYEEAVDAWINTIETVNEKQPEIGK